MSKKEDILQTRNLHPFLTLQAIGTQFSVSRQYVHKILKKAGLHTGTPKPLQSARYCVQCGNRTLPKTKTCSEKCRFALYYMRVACSFCRDEFYRRTCLLKKSYYLNYKNIYCSQKCYQRGRLDVY